MCKKRNVIEKSFQTAQMLFVSRNLAKGQKCFTIVIFSMIFFLLIVGILDHEVWTVNNKFLSFDKCLTSVKCQFFFYILILDILIETIF